MADGRGDAAGRRGPRAGPRPSRRAASAPDYGSIKVWGQAEVGFFGNQPTPSSEDAILTSAAVRMRHFFVKFETPVLDVLANQYHDLFDSERGAAPRVQDVYAKK